MRRSTNPRGTVTEEHIVTEFPSLQNLIEFVKNKGVENLDEVEFWSDWDNVMVEFKRPETDAEMNKRIDKEKRAVEAEKKKRAEEKSRKEAHERREYERLKRKFESK